MHDAGPQKIHYHHILFRRTIKGENQQPFFCSYKANLYCLKTLFTLRTRQRNIAITKLL